MPQFAGFDVNGEQNRSGAQLVADARASLTSAASVRLLGSLAVGGVVTPVDLRLRSDGDLSGSLGTTSAALQVQRVGTSVYVRPTGTAAGVRSLTDRLGLPPSVVSTAPGQAFWRLDSTAATGVVDLGLPSVAASLLPAGTTAAAALRSGDVDGTPVVTAALTGGGSVDVAVTGDVRVVRLVDGASGGTELSIEVDATAPPPFPVPSATGTAAPS